MPSTRRRRQRGLATIAAGVLAAVVLAGFASDLAPAFDSIGHFRAHAAAALVVVSLVLLARRRPAFALVGLAIGAFGLVSAAPFMLPARPAQDAGAPSYTLLQMNLLSDAPDRGQALSLIARLRPDVVSAQELTPDWHADFARLESAYPFQFFCREPFLGGSDTAILSRRPFVTQGDGAVCDVAGALAARRIDFNGIVVTVGSQHLRWPWPGRQADMLAAVLPSLARLGGPTIIGGDFNAAPWSASVRRFAEASRTRVLAGVGPTWLTRFLPASWKRFAGLPIDHILVSDEIEVLDVETLAPTASDHLPVLTTFTMRFALPEEPDVQSASRHCN